MAFLTANICLEVETGEEKKDEQLAPGSRSGRSPLEPGGKHATDYKTGGEGFF